MSLNLDKRQRAMLLEMGVHVWQPETLAPLPMQTETVAAGAGVGADAGAGAGVGAASAAGQPVSSLASSQPQTQAPARPVAPAALQRETPPPAPTSPRPASQPAAAASSGSGSGSGSGSARPPAQGGTSAVWLLGEAQLLYADTAQAGGARWLVLAETPPAALYGGALESFSAFAGDAGQLLDNMLRAARLNRAGAVLLAPLVRQGAGAVTPEFSAALATLVAQARPDTVLLMGRLASQALLPGEPFGKRRGHVHALHGARAIVTYDAPYLLRAPDDKAKAWADLCLAMSAGG